MKAVLVIALLGFVIAPTLFVAAKGNPTDRATEKAGGTFRYADERMGEKQDLSDKFMFARIHFGPVVPGAYWGDGTRGSDSWSHDYPEAGLHLRKILSELSKMPVYTDINEYVFTFNDPNLCKYPLAYLCEVGYMDLSEDEIKGMREYLLRGGFLIVDDFRSNGQYQNFYEYVKRAFPEDDYKIKPLDLSHPIFNCFFSIPTLDVHSKYDRGKPQFLGLEDKHGRLMMMINFNTDVSDFWQWSNDPSQPLEDSNTAYKFGVNYVFYAMTH
ncbi:MAG: DUF4159 domain-containing protein [Acidobacteria bacterium]|nr:DUF4159 domain-containing protein [Acidobacteriota bacterium]